MPGTGKMQKQVEAAGFDDSMLRQQIALINSMTKKERANPAILQASRKKRIAKGAGLEVSDLNKLLKQHRQMADMMKTMGKKGMLKQAMSGMFGKGKDAAALPDPGQLDPKLVQMAERQMMGGGSLPGGLSGMFKKK